MPVFPVGSRVFPHAAILSNESVLGYVMQTEIHSHERVVHRDDKDLTGVLELVAGDIAGDVSGRAGGTCKLLAISAPHPMVSLSGVGGQLTH